MKMIPFRFVLPIALAAGLSAQEAAAKPANAARPLPPVVTLQFQGGTLADFVAAVRGVEPKANIVVAAAAADARLPAIAVKNAGLDQVLDSACAVAEGQDRIQCSEQRGIGDPVFAIIARPAASAAGVAPMPEQTTMVLSLNRLTEGIPAGGVAGLRVETILSAIDAATSFEKKSPMMRFHQDSGLLFLRGSPAQLSLASEVLQCLERDQKERIGRGKGAATELKGDKENR